MQRFTFCVPAQLFVEVVDESESAARWQLTDELRAQCVIGIGDRDQLKNCRVYPHDLLGFDGITLENTDDV